MGVIPMLAAHLGAVPLVADVLTDPFGWLLGGLLRAMYGTDDGGAVRQALDGWMGQLLDPSDPGNRFRLDAMCGRCGDIYGSLRPLGLFALALAVLTRVAAQALRGRHEGVAPVHLLADAGIRLLCGLAALQVTYPILDWLSAQSMVLAAEVGGLAFDVALRQVGAESVAAIVMGATGQSQIAGSSATVLLTIYVGYLSVMVVASRAAIIFCVLGAPFSVPAMAYAEDGRIALLWLRMLFFALALPVAAVLCLTITAVVFAASLHVGQVGAIPLVALLACIWISVKLVNGLMMATVRSVRGGVSGTLQAAGMGPAAQRLGAISREARRDIGRVGGVGRMVAGAARSGGVDGVFGFLRPPAAGANAAFDLFVSRNHLKTGRSKEDGRDLAPGRQEALRTRLWASFLARESGLIGRPERAA
jgi:hypothetical protein